MEDERRWVESCLAGDPDAFRPLVERYQDRIFGLAMRLTGNAEDAREIAQDVFLRAFRALDSFDLTRPFSTWIRTIAANLARDRLRRQARGEPKAVAGFPGLPHEAPGPVADAARLEDADRVHRAVEELPAEARDLIAMRYFEELSLGEIAERTGLRRSTLKVRLFRLRRELARRLTE
jgi:RNA polymerase sigma-70 factor (ECF subfamily)